MAKLARFRGHFYNWYDTNDLRPLEPAYVSTVDSGNLAGHLIALANGLEEWQRTPVAAPTLVDGLNDALALASRPLAAAPWPQAADTPLVEAATALRQALRSPAPSAPN